MCDSLSIIFDHVSRTLPDSLSSRKALLQAMDDVVTDTHPVKHDLRAQISVLECVERMQQELQLKFKNLTTK